MYIRAHMKSNIELRVYDLTMLDFICLEIISSGKRINFNIFRYDIEIYFLKNKFRKV